MKKLVSVILTMVFVLSLSVSSVLAAETDYNKILNDVNKTNMEINEMIYRAVEDAEEEAKNYIKDLQILEKGKDVIKLEDEIAELRIQLYNLDNSKKDYQDKYDKILKELNNKEDQISKLVQKQENKMNKLLNELQELKLELDRFEEGSRNNVKIKNIINKFEAQIDKSNKQIQERTDKFNEKIDRIIERLINDTNQKAADMKNRAAGKGITVICELVEIQIGGQNILIDPLRIAGF